MDSIVVKLETVDKHLQIDRQRPAEQPPVDRGTQMQMRQKMLENIFRRSIILMFTEDHTHLFHMINMISQFKLEASLT